MTVRRYRQHGLTLDSELPLDDEPVDAAGPADVLLLDGSPVAFPPTQGQLLATAAPGARHDYRVVAADGALSVVFPGWASFAVDAGRRRATAHVDAAAPSDARSLLVTNLLDVLLNISGETVLHASAIQVGDGAVALVGPSGRGKTTLAGLLCTAGARFVTDDLLRVGRTTPATCWRGGAALRLRRTSRELDGTRAPWIHGRTTGDGRLSLRPPRTEHDVLPLRGVVAPRPQHPRDGDPAAGVGLHRLRAGEAFRLLGASPRLDGWTAPDIQARRLEHTAELAAAASFFVLDVPWGPPFSPAVVDEVLESLDRGLPTV